MSHEVKWACGCHSVDGVLAVECTQVAPQGEISASQHAVAKPFSPRCSRKAAEIHEVPKAPDDTAEVPSVQ